jgi:ankyrin repeat protein
VATEAEVPGYGDTAEDRGLLASESSYDWGNAMKIGKIMGAFKNSNDENPKQSRSHSRSKDSLGSLRFNYLIVLCILAAALVALFLSDVGGLRSTAALSLLRQGLDHQSPGMVRSSLRLSESARAEMDPLLARAVRQNQADKVRLLLSLGADPNVIVKTHFSALYWCALKGYTEEAEWLVKAGADMDARPYKGWTALSVAIRRHHNPLVRLLMEAGAGMAPDPEFIKKSPLWVAAASGNMEALEDLLAAGVDTNMAIPNTIAGRRPFSVVDYALSKGQYAAAKRLILETGPQRLTDQNVTAQPFIANYCLAGIQRALIRRQYASFRLKKVNPIITAIQQKAPDASILATIEAHPATIIDAEDETGDTALMAAVEADRQVVVARLIAKGCDVNKPDGNGYTAALLAAEEGFLPIFRLLIRAGFDPAHCGCQKDSLFTFLIHRELIDPFKILVEEESDLNKADPTGTPLQVALACGRTEFARVLLEGGADPTRRAGDLTKVPLAIILDDPAYESLRPLLGTYLTESRQERPWIIQKAELTGAAHLHVLSVYQGRDPRRDQYSRIPVLVSDSTEPVTLVLNSYRPVLWQVQAQPGVTIQKVYAMGYCPPRVTGLDATTPRTISTAENRNYIKPLLPDDGKKLLEMMQALENLIGRRPTTVQCAYEGIGFTVDGIKTINFRSPPPPAASAKPKPAAHVSPVAEKIPKQKEPDIRPDI